MVHTSAFNLKTSCRFSFENTFACITAYHTPTPIFSPLLGTGANHTLGAYSRILSTMTELIDNVDCTGTEPKLMDCSHNINLHSSYISPKVVCRYCKHGIWA